LFVGHGFGLNESRERVSKKILIAALVVAEFRIRQGDDLALTRLLEWQIDQELERLTTGSRASTGRCVSAGMNFLSGLVIVQERLHDGH
jgi:hypothetical protein